MRIWKIAYVATGVLLAAGSVATAEHGLSSVNKDIYQSALALDVEMQKLGFDGFTLQDRKVRFYDGDCDYVVETDADKQMVVTKETAQLDVFAGTTLEVDGQWQVLLPTYEQFSGLFDTLGTLGSYQQRMQEGAFDFAGSEYDDRMHAATIWHEAFHAWQAENWHESMDMLSATTLSMSVSGNDTLTAQTQEGDKNPTDIIVREADASEELRTLFTEEMAQLMNAYNAQNPAEKKEWVAKALETANLRSEELSDEAAAMEYYLENYEGSARYVECMAYREMAGDDAWREIYLKDFQYANGSEKYYHMGMLKCVLLDQLADGWQQEMSDKVGLDELLSKQVKY